MSDKDTTNQMKLHHSTQQLVMYIHTSPPAGIHCCMYSYLLSTHTLCCIPSHLPPHPVPAPGVTVTRVTSSQVEYETTAYGSATRVIAGYEVTRFGVPMIGQYVNTGRGRRVTISPAVPGAQYRYTAWALGDGSRSATPTVVDATTRKAG